MIVTLAATDIQCHVQSLSDVIRGIKEFGYGKGISLFFHSNQIALLITQIYQTILITFVGFFLTLQQETILDVMMNFAAVFVVKEFDDFIGTWFLSQLQPLQGMMEVVYEKDSNGNEIKFRTIHHKLSTKTANLFAFLIYVTMYCIWNIDDAKTTIVENPEFLNNIVSSLIVIVFLIFSVIQCFVDKSEENMDRLDAKANIFQVAEDIENQRSNNQYEP